MLSLNAHLMLASGSIPSLIMNCLLLMGGLVILYLGIRWARNFLLGDDEDDSPMWDLDGIRQLRDRGEITEDEYRQLRATIIGAVTGKADAASDRKGTTDNSAATEKNSDFDLKSGPQG